MLPIYFAPLQGYTDDVYRRIHHKLIGGVKEYYTPFVRVVMGGIRSKDIRDINPENNKNIPVVPQIIFSNRKEFEYLVSRVEALGYKQIDLNMGCPFPLQAKHGRGAGILANQNIINDIIEGIKEHSNIKFSVKLRLGWDNNNEAKRVVKSLNCIDLQHITIHPRTGIQQYKGKTDITAFTELYNISHNPIIYNGDIITIEDIIKIEEQFPHLLGIMVGRGLLGRPSLAKEYSTNKPATTQEVISIMLDMHQKLMEEYSKILEGDTQILNKLKTYWEYTELLLGRKPYKKIIKSGNLKNYMTVLNELRFI